MLTLYHAPTGVCAQKVRVGLAEIGLDYESVLLDLQKGDQFEPDYLKLNPDAVVPTLIDDGRVLVESGLILEYLDREYNSGRLMPKGRGPGAIARHWLLRGLAIHAAINTMSFSTAYRAKILATKTPEEIAAMVAKFPDPVMGAKRRDLIENGLASAYVGQALMYLRRTLMDMSAALLRGPWIDGDVMGISDISLVAYLDRLDRLGMNGFWSEDRPEIGRWLGAMRARPSYEAGIGAFTAAASADPMRREGMSNWPEIERRWQTSAA